jgi:hypothetical protein
MIMSAIFLCVEIVLGVIATIVLSNVPRYYSRHSECPTNGSKMVTTLVLGEFIVIACIVLISVNWTIFAIPKILLLFTLSHLWLIECDFSRRVHNCITVLIPAFAFSTIFAYFLALLFTGGCYFANIHKCTQPDVTVTSYEIVSSYDALDDSENASYGTISCYTSIGDEVFYSFHYQHDGGTVRMASIPADSTTVHYIEDDEQPRVDEVVSTSYYINYNDNAAHLFESSTTTYELYVHNGSIITE